MAEQSVGEAVAAEAVASPCIGVCKFDAITTLCRGCLRSADEIGLWRDADGRLRRRILDRIAQRRAAGLVPVTAEG